MSRLEAYLAQRRRAEMRLWLGYGTVSAACMAMILLMLYV